MDHPIISMIEKMDFECVVKVYITIKGLEIVKKKSSYHTLKKLRL